MVANPDQPKCIFSLFFQIFLPRTFRMERWIESYSKIAVFFNGKGNSEKNTDKQINFLSLLQDNRKYSVKVYSHTYMPITTTLLMRITSGLKCKLDLVLCSQASIYISTLTKVLCTPLKQFYSCHLHSISYFELAMHVQCHFE